MKKPKVYKKEKRTYGRYLESSHIRVSPIIWILLALLVAAIVGFLFFMLFPSNPTVALVLIIVIPTLIVGMPVILKEQRDTRMEDAIPDVFEELATSLRAGATIEQALLDLIKIQKGPLIDELKITLNEMEGGFSFEESLDNLITRLDILMLKRIFKIVIDGKKAGGELADILDAVSSDAREISRLQRERRSKTLMYVIFIFAAGGVVAPLIYGFVSQIGVVIVNIGAPSGVVLRSPLELPGIGLNIFWLYLIIECLISGVMLAVVRGVRVWKGIIFYALPMIMIGTLVFEVSKIIAGSMLGH